MAGAAISGGFRRNGDGSPDIAFYRRRARRLRRAARAGLWRGVRRRTAGALARALSAALGTNSLFRAAPPRRARPAPEGDLT
jgi:hypothetical protein